jgi:hypothetical protein
VYHLEAFRPERILWLTQSIAFDWTASLFQVTAYGQIPDGSHCFLSRTSCERRRGRIASTIESQSFRADRIRILQIALPGIWQHKAWLMQAYDE